MYLCFFYDIYIYLSNYLYIKCMLVKTYVYGSPTTPSTITPTTPPTITHTTPPTISPTTPPNTTPIITPSTPPTSYTYYSTYYNIYSST